TASGLAVGGQPIVRSSSRECSFWHLGLPTARSVKTMFARRRRLLTQPLVFQRPPPGTSSPLRFSLVPFRLVPDVYGVFEDLPDRGVESVAELFAGTSDIRSLAIGFRGTAGAGVDTALRSLARMARLNGFVPVTVSEMTERVTTLIGRRSLF